jgi:ATP-dependent RNA helicase DeaD
MNEFAELGLGNEIIDVLESMGFKKPSEIQKKSIPSVLKGKDVIGNAATGSGKTLAFACGLIQNLIPGGGVQGLVLTPTRELAEQISRVIKNFAKNTKLGIQEVYGGASMDKQIRGIRKSEIIIGTPGRTLDHLMKKTLDLSKVKILVLDEADRMVDMGFLRDVEEIIKKNPKNRQILLFSATTSKDVEHIEKKYMNSPEQVTVEVYVDPEKLKQEYYDCGTTYKFPLLVHLLKKEKAGLIMVFCNTRSMVDALDRNLSKNKISSQAIHGGLTQGKRGRIIDKMHNNEVDVLVCTDVAARGLDIKGVTHVYNFDCPKSSEEYIHRIGRTARVGNDGKAITLLSNRDYDNFRNVIEDSSIKIEKKELPKVERVFFELRENRRSTGRNNYNGKPRSNDRDSRRGFGFKKGNQRRSRR